MSTPNNIPHKGPQQKNSETHSWPLDLSALKSPPTWLANVICGLVFIATILLLFLSVVSVARLAADLLGDDPQKASEAVKSLLPIAAAAIGLPLIVWRLVILNQQTRISENKTQIDRETHYTNIFSKSVEQLGQTKEVKESRYSNNNLETHTRTVANIEIRLGGIHSLSRLAEESARDAKKIENMLLSYVRENSWINRDGATTTKLTRVAADADWHSAFRRNSITGEMQSKFAAWVSRCDENFKSDRNWATATYDTRVDINEAIDAAFNVRGQIKDVEQSLFYESLFVARKFKFHQSKGYRFERCTFARCVFEIVDFSKLEFSNCRFVDCGFSVKESELSFSRSHLTNTNFYQTTASLIGDSASEFLDCGFWNIEKSEVKLSRSTMYDCWWSSGKQGPLSLQASSASLGKGNFSYLTFQQSSRLQNVAFADVAFNNCDLSAVHSIEGTSFETTTAKPNINHPSAIPRPAAWPAFDPDFKDDDEIPF